MDKRFTRRDFIRTGTAAGVAAGLGSFARSQEGAQPMRLGFIGTGGRGTYLLGLALGHPEVEVPALCDINEANLNNAIALVRDKRGAAPEGYSAGPTDYRRLLERDDLEGVVVATPQNLHGPMAIDALHAGKHVLSEVSAAMELEHCWGLVRAQRESGKVYMLSENCCYYRQNMAVLNMVQQGLFGDLTVAECGYVHDCRALMFNGDGSLTWRGEALARDYIGNLYPTHAIGPVAQWLGINHGDRFESLVSFMTPERSITRYAAQRFGADSAAAKVPYACGDSTTTLLRTSKGVVVEIRYDVVSPRPVLSTTYCTLQGTTASWDDRDAVERIWVEGRSPEHTWKPAAPYVQEFDHQLWREFGETASSAGHGGCDWFMVPQFLEAVRAGGPAPIDAVDAATWSAIIPLSAASIRAGGPVEFPDFAAGA